MKNSKIYSRLGELSLKYVNEGLTIDFEFNRFEMILRGCLDLSLTKYKDDFQGLRFFNGGWIRDFWNEFPTKSELTSYNKLKCGR